MYLSDVCGSKVVAEKSIVRFGNKCKCPLFKILSSFHFRSQKKFLDKEQYRGTLAVNCRSACYQTEI